MASWQLISLSEQIAIAELAQIADILKASNIVAGNGDLAGASQQIDEIAKSLVGVEGSVTRSTTIGGQKIPDPADYSQ